MGFPATLLQLSKSPPKSRQKPYKNKNRPKTAESKNPLNLSFCSRTFGGFSQHFWTILKTALQKKVRHYSVAPFLIPKYQWSHNVIAATALAVAAVVKALCAAIASGGWIALVIVAVISMPVVEYGNTSVTSRTFSTTTYSPLTRTRMSPARSWAASVQPLTGE